MTINVQLQKLIAEFFNQPEAKISLSTSNNDIEEWDSLEHIKLILEIEEKFNVKFPLDVIPNMVNIKAIQEEINRMTNE